MLNKNKSQHTSILSLGIAISKEAHAIEQIIILLLLLRYTE